MAQLGSIANMFIPPHLDVNQDDPSIKLKLKIFGGPSAGKVYYFKHDPSAVK